jgi:hypothetical protein
MLCKSTFLASLLLATIAASLSQSASAASRQKHTALSRHRVYGVYRGDRFAQPAVLAYGAENGFLRKVPPNAIVGPGYTFVPGVGILGESCDLPTSACPNEYRDVQ